MTALRMFEPQCALMLGIIIITNQLAPAKPGTLATWDEIVRGAEFIVVQLALLNIALSTSTPNWKFLLLIGWGQLVLALFIRFFLEIPYN